MAADTMGSRIERARIAARLNKNQLARAIGTSWQHVDHWERDRMAPNTGSLARIASVLGVSVAYLLGEERAPESTGSEALDAFLASYAPADLTPHEVAWLRAAPIDPALATPGTYVDLLHRVRAPRPPSVAPAPPPRSGSRAKVELADVEKRVRAGAKK